MNEARAMLNNAIDGLNVLSQTHNPGGTIGTQTLNVCPTVWTYWQDYYYPQVIRESYPVYIQERAKDEGKKAFEIIKVLQDKKLIKLDKVSDFVEAMDTLIKIL